MPDDMSQSSGMVPEVVPETIPETIPETNTEIYAVTIESLTADGQGIARIPGLDGDSSRGLTVFCDGLLPGEEAMIRIRSKKKSYALAECVRRITLSPGRIVPYCQSYEACGGCTLQHLSYEEQLVLKREHIISCLTRIGKQPAGNIEALTRPTLGMEYPYDYRNHMQYPVGEKVEAHKDTPSDTPDGTPGDTPHALPRDLKIGLYGKKSHTIVPHSACRLAHPACESVRRMTERFCLEKEIQGYDENTGLGFLRHLIIRVGHQTGEVMVILVVNSTPDKLLTFPAKEYADAVSRRLEKDRKRLTRENANQSAGILASTLESTLVSEKPWKLKSIWINFNPTGARQGQTVSFRPQNQLHLWGALTITDRIGENKYIISPLSFFQINPLQTEKLYDTVRDFALGNLTPRPAAANPEAITATLASLLDLYCGAGTIGLHMARHTAQLLGVESSESAVLDARRNAAQNGITHAKYLCASVEEVPASAFPAHPTCVILDPPRKGCHPAVLTRILSLSPDKIIYISCDAATLARDIAILAGGEYKITAIQPVDMFPWTGHVETVVLMSRDEAGKD